MNYNNMVMDDPINAPSPRYVSITSSGARLRTSLTHPVARMARHFAAPLRRIRRARCERCYPRRLLLLSLRARHPPLQQEQGN